MRKFLPSVIKSRTEINRVVRQAEKKAGKHLVAYVQDTSENGLRFCVLIDSKIRGAVKRNRIKRLLREIVRKNQGWFKPGTNLVLFYPLGMVDITYKELEADFRNLFL